MNNLIIHLNGIRKILTTNLRHTIINGKKAINNPIPNKITNIRSNNDKSSPSGRIDVPPKVSLILK